MVKKILKKNPKVLHYEVGSLRLVLQRIQDTVTNMNEEVNGIHHFLGRMI